MRLKLTWKNTQDELLFDVINDDLVGWFVEKSNSQGQNRYETGDQVIDELVKTQDTEVLIKQEIEYINTVNDVLTKLKLPKFDFPDNWFNQAQLNKLHKDWSETRYQQPKLTELLYKIDKKYYEAYQEMNCHIHLIERSFQHRFRDKTHWRIKNPFHCTAYEWQVCHLYLEYPGHGRNAFEKFQWIDDGADSERDVNNWDNIDSMLGINFVKPYKIEPPQEFLEWCQQQNLVPHGYSLPLANLSDWRNQLSKARKMVTENVKIKDNYFSLKIME
jgi:hypothetical protein